MTHTPLSCSPEGRDDRGRFTEGNPQGADAIAERWDRRDRTAAELLADWPPAIRTVEDAQRRLQIIGDLCVRGLLPGAQAGAAVRSCEVWLKSEETRAGIQRVAELEEQLHRLETDRLSVRRGQHG